MRKFIFVALLLSLALAVLVPAASANTPGKATVYVVHGIPGKDLGLADNSLPVDIKVGPLCALSGFTFGEIAGPVVLDPGTYRVEISLANAGAPCSNAPVIAENVVFGRSETLSVVAHLRVGGQPTLTKFSHFVGFLKGTGSARIDVRHTANAPAVDVELTPAGGSPILIEDFVNVQVNFAAGRIRADVPATTYAVNIFPANTTTPVFSVPALPLAAEKIYLVWAVGSVQNSTFTLLLKAIDPAF